MILTPTLYWDNLGIRPTGYFWLLFGGFASALSSAYILIPEYAQRFCGVYILIPEHAQCIFLAQHTKTLKSPVVECLYILIPEHAQRLFLV